MELADGVIEAAQGRRARAAPPPMHGAITTHDPLRAFCDVFRQLQNAKFVDSTLGSGFSFEKNRC